MSAIKKFFEKKKLDVKFKQAGQGRTLNDPACSTSSGSSGKRPSSSGSTQRRPPSQGAARAAEAALARLDSSAAKAKPAKKIGGTTTWKNPEAIPKDHNAIDPKKLKSEMLQGNEKAKPQARPSTSRLPTSEGLAIEEEVFEGSPCMKGVSFSCPMCPVCLPEDEINHHIEECLSREIDSEPGMIAASMIHTLNRRDKVKPCIETLNKYLDNIIKNPNEEKFRKIKQSNKIFRERVANIKGVSELLTLAIGFVDVKMPIPSNDETFENFYVLNEELALDTDRLNVIKEYLNEAEPLKATLDRNVKVYQPAIGANNPHLPDEFFEVSNLELKREKLLREESVEQSRQLMTKAMRDAMKQSAKRCYRFTLIRIRFPDGHLLEGIFYSKGKLSEVESFIRESIELDWCPFELRDASGKRLNQSSETLESLNLSPASILNFQWDPSLVADASICNQEAMNKFLTDELLARRISL